MGRVHAVDGVDGFAFLFHDEYLEWVDDLIDSEADDVTRPDGALVSMMAERIVLQSPPCVWVLRDGYPPDGGCDGQDRKHPECVLRAVFAITPSKDPHAR